MNRVTTPKIAAGAADRPEEICVLVPAGDANLAVRGDDLDLLEVVDGPTEAARQIPEPATEGEAGDPDLGDEAENRREPVLLRRPVDILEQTPRSNVGELGIGIDGQLRASATCRASGRAPRARCRRCCGRRP